MFDQTFVPPSNRTRSGASLAVSLAAQAAVIVVLILVPLVYTEALPRTTLNALLTAPAPPPPPPPPPPVHEAVVKRQPRVFNDSIFRAPKTIPPTPAIIRDDDAPPAPSVGVAGSVPRDYFAADASRSITNLIGGRVDAPPPPVVKPPVQEKRPAQIRVSQGVIQASLLKRVVPQYPPLARQARVQGTVRFSAIIGKDGTIQNLQLISGHPLLVGAATDAIKQWVYRPTFLGQDPVEVITQIEFTFTLSQ